MATTSALSSGVTPEYADAMLKFLGDREPLEVFAATPGDLRKAVAGMSEKAVHTPEAPGKWSVAAVVQHLADAELVLGFRYRSVIAQPGRAVPAFDQDAWADALAYAAVNIATALDDFEAIRRTNLRVLRAVKPAQWEQFAMHEQRGKETLQHMVRLYAAHDCYHLFQIERIKKAIGA